MSGELTIESIPHRDPFLFVDEIVSVERDKIITRKLADPEAEFFKGHYPGHPVMPGVLICEAVFQAAALLTVHRLGSDSAQKGVPVLTRIKDARFKRMVRPGETFEVEVVVDDELDGAFYFTGWVRVDGEQAVRVSFASTRATEQGHVS